MQPCGEVMVQTYEQESEGLLADGEGEIILTSPSTKRRKNYNNQKTSYTYDKENYYSKKQPPYPD